MPTETYRSEEAYRKARAYTHIHGIKTHAEKVCIKGHGCHKVRHGTKGNKRKTATKRYGK
jgi:hypothetical protein